MPLLKITSNQPMDNDRRAAMLPAISSSVAEMLGKSERYVMVSFVHNPAMLFAGNDEPMLFLQLKSIGLPEDKTSSYSANLCALMESQMGVQQDRIYIEFSNAERHLWGWNGGTF